jgi:chromosome segregation ATPase
MFGTFEKSWEQLDSKISELESKINSATSLFGSYDRYRWRFVLDLCKEINDEFKKVRYPKKQERSIAWQKFFDLRHLAYQEKNKQIALLSRSHKSEIYDMLRYVDYDWFGDFLVGKLISFGLLATKVEDMKWAGKKLKEAGTHFKNLKHEMTREDKSEVYQRFVDIRSNHDHFWSKYKESSQADYERRKKEKQKVWEEKQNAWEEKQEKSRRIKTRIEDNLSNNKEKLDKAIDALERVRDNRSNLRDKISDSYNDDWKSKAEGWLDEMDDKISDIESSIDRIRDWVSEDQEKLNNWN